MKKKSLIALATVVTFLFLITPAMASQFTIDWGTVGEADVDYVGFAGTSNDFNDSDTAYITDFKITSLDPSVKIDSALAYYCVALDKGIGQDTYYGELLDLTTLVDSPLGNTNDYRNAARLVAGYGLNYDFDNDALEEQLQLSVWETLYETDSTYSLGSGVFDSEDYSFLSVPTEEDISDWRVLRLVDDKGKRQQDLLVKVSSVPVPPSVLLLASGLLGLVGIRRRKKV